MISNTWYKKSYVASEDTGEGIEVGIDDFKIYEKVLNNMSEIDTETQIDVKYVKKQLLANQHTPLTAFYFLLLKKKIIEGEPLEETEDGVLPPSAALLIPKDR